MPIKKWRKKAEKRFYQKLARIHKDKYRFGLQDIGLVFVMNGGVL